MIRSDHGMIRAEVRMVRPDVQWIGCKLDMIPAEETMSRRVVR
jgi:hypothetical protein